MAENEASIGIELSVGGGPVPASAKLSASLKRGWVSRGQEVLTAVAESVGADDLSHRLDDNPEVEVLLARAINAAAASALEGKRRLLARIVQDAVLDDAAVDKSTVILDVLEQIDAVHIRCLEAIARAEQESKHAVIGRSRPNAPRSRTTNESSQPQTCIRHRSSSASGRWDWPTPP